MSKIPDYCPYLGLRHNRGLCLSSPTPEHRCYSQAEGVAISVDQGTYCLSPLHTMCPIFQAQSEASVADPGLPDLPDHGAHERKVIPIDRHSHRLQQASRMNSSHEEAATDWPAEPKQPQQPPAEWYPDSQVRPQPPLQRTAEEEALAQRLARPDRPVQRTAEEEALAQRLARPDRRAQLQRPVAAPPPPPAEWRGEQRVASPQRPVAAPPPPPAEWRGEQRVASPQRPVAAPPQPPAEWRGEQRVAPPQRPVAAPPPPPAEWRGEQRVASPQRPVAAPPQPPAEWRGEQRVAPPQRPAQVQRLLPSQPVADWQGEQRPAPPSDVVPPRLRAQARKSYTQVIAQTQADRDWLSAALTAQTPAAPLPQRESSDRPAWAMPEHAALLGPHQPGGSKLGDISNILTGSRFQFLRSAALGAIAPVVVLTLAAIIGIGSWQRADLFAVQGQSATTNVPQDLLSEGETSSETQKQPTELATSTASVPTLEPSSVTEEAALATTSVIATDVAITPVISVPTPTIAPLEPTPTFPSMGEGILIVPTITGGGAATPMVMTLYFPDPSSATIVPAQYEIREPDGVTIANVLKGLLAGPPANLAPTLAPGTQVLSVAFDGGTLSIDLDRPIPGILERRALELTLAQFPGITSVRLLVKGTVI